MVTSLSVTISQEIYGITLDQPHVQYRADITGIIGNVGEQILTRFKVIDNNTFVTLSDKSFTDTIDSSKSFQFFPEAFLTVQPSSVVINMIIKDKVTGTTLFNESRTIQFTGNILKPTPNMVAINFEGLGYANRLLSGTVKFDKAKAWNNFFDDKVVTGFVQTTDIDTGIVIDLFQKDFTFGTNSSFSLGVSRGLGQGVSRISVESFLWVNGSALSISIFIELTDTVTPEPEPILSRNISVTFEKGTGGFSTSLSPNDFILFTSFWQTSTGWNFVHVSNSKIQPPLTTFAEIKLRIENEIADISIPNVLFDMVFADGHRLDFVLTSVDFDTFVNAQLFPNVALQNVRDSTANAITIAQVNSAIQFHLDSEPILPPEPDSNSYTMELKSSSYLPTPEGKTINIQIEVVRIGTGINSAIATLQVKQGLTGLIILIETQSLQIGGANIFPIVFNVPDIGATKQATATLDFQVFMQFSETDPRFLTQFPLTGKLIFQAPPTIPPSTMAKGSVMQKILGGLAMLGTTVLLTSKGR